MPRPAETTNPTEQCEFNRAANIIRMAQRKPMGKRRFSGLELALIVMFILMTIAAIALIALFVTEKGGTKGESTNLFVPQCPNIALGQRVDCFPDAGASKQLCEARGCCWNPLDERNVPWCFFPTNHGYTVEKLDQSNPNAIQATLRRMASPTLYGADIQELALHAEMQTSKRLHFKIFDPQRQRFEVPHEHISGLNAKPTSPIGDIMQITNNPFGITVRRRENKKVLFDTTMAPLVFADQYLQISAKLPSHNVYGLGEHVHQNFRHDMNWRTWPIFTRDAFPNGGTHNLYGHYPFFLCLEDESGKSFGVFLLNSNAMEVTLQPLPAVTYRTIGGVLDFYILFGDTPEQVVQEFLELIGRPVIPTYWSLGFQLSRWDYGSLDEVKATVERNRAVQIPYDIQYTDIDYMEDKKDFTYDKVKFADLPKFYDYMHEKGQRYILILDPAIAISKRVGNTPYESYDRGTARNAWIFESDGKTPLVGEVWPGLTVFPDYTSQACIDWWVDEYEMLYNEIKHDALWIDMNEVASFIKGSVNGCPDNSLNYPPYTPTVSSMDAGGAFYPFSRNHNAQGYRPQDPAWYGADSTLVRSSKHYLTIRYTLLPYLYTLFYKAHTTGETVVRPMMHEFYWDSATWTVDRQFLWGKGLLITPVLDPGTDTVRAYVPDAVWYDYDTMEKIAPRRQFVDMYIPGDKLGLHIRGGAILPTQQPAVTTTYSRTNPMGLIIALDDNSQATGELFWDDGDTRETVETGKYIHYQFSVIYGVLTIQATHVGYTDPNNLKIDDITILGVPLAPSAVTVKNTATGAITNVPTSNIQHDNAKDVLFLRHLSLTLGESYTIQWDQSVPEFQRFDCHPEENADEAKCKARGCIWEPSNLEKVPWCYYPDDYGYTYTTFAETDSGITLDITRNIKYRSTNRAGSPDIDKLRVQVFYHTSDLLQFKYKMNCYGIHPFYMGLENTADAHGVLLLNSNAMDVTFQPTPAITYRTLGGILDFYMVMGPTPELVVQEYTALVGRPVLPAYWSLGFQLCRYGYENDTEIKNLYTDMKAAGIPYDVQYADIDYMERQLDFMLDRVNFAGLPALVDEMRAEGMRFIFILDPAISGNETQPYPAFTNGIAQDVFIKYPASLGGDIVWGKVWPDRPGVVVDPSLDWDTQVELYRAYAAFPDFFKTSTALWWKKEINDFYNNVVKFDGIWIDMNEPASFVHGTVGGKCLGDQLLEYPPYMPPLESKHMGLNHKTLCMNSEQILPNGKHVRHYDVHNLYGWSHTKPTYDALLDTTKKRGIVVTRSTYPSSGQWAGHWLGDNYASWDQLYKSIIGMMEFSLFGIPYRQDPVAWDEFFANTSRDALNIRYTLLPYLYTLMFEAHTKGSTVIRPMLHEFVLDRKTWEIHRQFLWGPALLITPALDKGVREVQGYVPQARWYDYHTAKDVGVRGQMVTMPTPLNHINLHVRGGYILPWQKPERNTVLSRKNPLGLIVALSDSNTAEGSFFWDDGEGIDTAGRKEYLLSSFSVQSNNLTNTVVHSGGLAADRLIMGVVKIWGAGTTLITQATFTDNSEVSSMLTPVHNVDTQELIFDLTSKAYYVDQPFSITWR
ncbi:hypothetical protein WMY93_014451 [Mugilogobius chulae]|uniref:Maltase n=1 Tax=Mugilogobius chulae TaxID=88201 RepID=A0AAW0NUZ9_9GOBI